MVETLPSRSPGQRPAAAAPTPVNGTRQIVLPVRDYDLAATLQSGQAFRWLAHGDGWEGVVHSRWVHLRQTSEGIHAQTCQPTTDWSWLEHYLQSGVDLDAILQTFPADAPMQESVRCCHGLRLLRQEPWECLASFILSSCKQIVQIKQIVETLARHYGDRIPAPSDRPPTFAFPSAERIAACSEAELRACKMGWRAPGLLQTAQRVANGQVDLASLHQSSCESARQRLLSLPGVGPKIANCVLLFAYGFPDAFPVDVWVAKAIRQLYFPKRKPSTPRMRRFLQTHFGPHAGYAQQYLFHYMRTRPQRIRP